MTDVRTAEDVLKELRVVKLDKNKLPEYRKLVHEFRAFPLEERRAAAIKAREGKLDNLGWP